MQQIAPFRSVIDADTLGANIENPAWRVIDCRHDLLRPDAGHEAYRRGHLRGAVFAHLDLDLSGSRNGRNGRHPLPAPDRLLERFRRWGIGPETQIVVYDATHGQYAGRFWWLARWMGHERVGLLDGGWQAALDAGLPVETTVAAPAPGRFQRRPGLEQAVETDTVAERRKDANWLVVDARAPDRYAGQNESIDPVAGHIPGAVNRFWQSNLQADGRFKPAVQLRAEFDALLEGRPASRLIAQCGSGVTACHHLVAMERAGLAGALLYPGSWSEWIADPSRPVATGASEAS